MSKGVDYIKMVLYKAIQDDLLLKHHEKSKDFCASVSATSVNEIFDCHNETTKPFYNSNKPLIIETIKSIGINRLDLKQPITDALRVYFTIGHMLSPKKDGNATQAMDVMHKAQEYGIFIKGGDVPEPSSFEAMSIALAQRYNIL